MATAHATRVASMALEQKSDNSETKGVRHLEHNCQGVEEKEQPLSLQEAFLQFRKKKQDELREKLTLEQKSAKQRQDPINMEKLRKKFLERALGYVGVPYAKRYHSPDSPTFHSELFLDCCGLVRRVVRDLKEDFGFVIGPWNQAYQFDTLPIELSGPQEMKPGDLVFISATYYNPKAKKQRHDMVHVEIWVGDGEKTLGARWQKGEVEIHDSYKFVSKSYHSMKFHFRSIDTWLSGECRSHCTDHLWVQRSFNPDKRSIFALSEDEHCNAYSQQEGEEEEQQVKGQETDQSTKVVAVCERVKEPAQQVSPSLSLKSVTSVVKLRAKASQAKTFVICGGNAAPLVERCLREQGWIKLEDKSSLNFSLKWVETRQHVDFKNFREGEQLVNRFPNIQLLTTKISLLENLRSYCKLYRQNLDSFVPETYRMDVTSEREEYLRVFKDGELWICKPTGANQGKGIFLVTEVQRLLDKLESDQRCSRPMSRPTARIVQRYISNPLLLRGRKFDIRVYMLVVAGSPWVVLYRDGYVRLCCEAYQLASPSLGVHLTNQYQQKKHPLYEELKEDTVWNFDKFQECLTEEHSLPSDWVSSTLTRKIISIMTTCFNSVKHKLTHAHGFFDLLGFDFMLDTQLNVWLIEVNVNPALHTNCTVLSIICPAVVQETLAIAIEVLSKCRRNKSPIPISALKHFRIIFPK